MKNSKLTTLNSKKIPFEALQEVKGGFRFVTRNRSAFESKPDKLQSTDAVMSSITHTNGVYCIDWYY